MPGYRSGAMPLSRGSRAGRLFRPRKPVASRAVGLAPASLRAYALYREAHDPFDVRVLDKAAFTWLPSRRARPIAPPTPGLAFP